MYKLLYLILCISQVALGAEQDTVVITKGQPAPFTGTLLDNSRAQRLDIIVKTSSYKDQELSILEQRITNANNEIDRLAKANASMKDMNTIEFIGSFALGALVTGMIGFGLVRATR